MEWKGYVGGAYELSYLGWLGVLYERVDWFGFAYAECLWVYADVSLAR
jgi:hypothetical protein